MTSHHSTHTLFEDLFALFSAGLFIAFGVFLFKSDGLLTRGHSGYCPDWFQGIAI
jgi:hypothetical protein